MSRMIDADALIAECGNWYVEEGTEEGFIGDLKNLIDLQPTIEPERKISTANGCPFLTCKHGGFGDDVCSKCRWAYRDMYEPDEEGAQE